MCWSQKISLFLVALCILFTLGFVFGALQEKDSDRAGKKKKKGGGKSK